tara:strand:+ start:4656 stop:5207 length:552 start_codon:yes stop_codon:yes gene_type:complete
MINNIHLVIGGIRSGKSDHAEHLAISLQHQVLYIATGKNTDPEMEKRIKAHKHRRPENWITLEEPSFISQTVNQHIQESNIPITILIDSIDFWITNRLLDHPDATFEQHQSWLAEQTSMLINTCKEKPVNTIIVTSEVGASLVSEHKMGRWFQDLIGNINQLLSNSSDTVDYVVAGNVLTIKS